MRAGSQSMRRTVVVVSRMLVCSCALACRDATGLPRDLGPVPDGSLMTNATSYVAERIAGSTRPVRYRFAVITRFQNRSAAAVYLDRCFPDSPQPIYGIGVADSSGRESAYAPFWACVGHNNQFEVLPGAVRVDTFVVEGPNMFDEVKQQAIGATTGKFRLSLSLRGVPGESAPQLPGTLGVSNAFIVRTWN